MGAGGEWKVIAMVIDGFLDIGTLNKADILPTPLPVVQCGSYHEGSPITYYLGQRRHRDCTIDINKPQAVNLHQIQSPPRSASWVEQDAIFNQ